MTDQKFKPAPGMEIYRAALIAKQCAQAGFDHHTAKAVENVQLDTCYTGFSEGYLVNMHKEFADLAAQLGYEITKKEQPDVA